ncbi:MAG: NAD(P)H-dependent oxidoreductase [Candidatus Devosia phytovorans]|uniref:NAD(P)H-dependent oxidoreductase n=1 Tax=Candidatus Devosia phytovorans TaxID=3121372 RepID=A0AAJ5VW47_9HYPH|nr:NAD(P)H-dependent oxidoreductase [Devosia sp.]WEK04995.1 MAG: NAD(P)H-dependent oxidoreductase [Devosia sp.]
MTKIFRLDASIRAEGSVTRAVADTMQSELAATLGNAEVIRRDVGLTPLPATAWAGSLFGRHVPAEQQTTEQREGIALATTLAEELLAADAYLFALPFYNFGVSQHFKAYADLLMTEPRFTPGQSPILAGRPAQLVVARGGGYGPGTPRFGWDHGTAWYQRLLSDVLGLELEVVEVELTLADVSPAMESLRGQAAENLRLGHAQARDNVGRLAQRLRA